MSKRSKPGAHRGQASPRGQAAAREEAALQKLRPAPSRRQRILLGVSVLLVLVWLVVLAVLAVG